MLKQYDTREAMMADPVAKAIATEIGIQIGQAIVQAGLTHYVNSRVTYLGSEHFNERLLWTIVNMLNKGDKS